ncbi:acyl-CoA synthetase (plasmid) [Pacificitalea manganoxidans]|uniref:Acyl-CoA synthetase n=2 Tax=Pacificitalea manganoxidans TaxID=1411902 RepID=A0A291M4I5_9RHOB|nr:acyl-CoA synthetase [Pacificitalea manganoxidans]
MVLGDQVSHNAARFPDKVALIEGDRKVSYAELDEMTNRVANTLRARGLAKGDNVAMLLGSGIDWVMLYVGITKADCCAVPMNYRLTAADIESTVEDCAPKLMFLGEAQHDIGPPEGMVPEIVNLRTGDLDGLVEGASSQRPDVSVHPSRVQGILYTGGTTGRSKGAMLTHENIFWNTLNEVIDTRMHEDDNTLLATPLHHAAALNCWLLPHLYLGATATIMPKYTVETMIDTIEKYRVTNAFMPPSMAREVFGHPKTKTADLSSFRRWYVGGATLSRNDRERMHEAIPGVDIYFQYGLTEAGVIVSVLKEKDYEKAPDSIGRAFVNSQIKILRADLSDADMGEVGEIAVRGPTVMKGYYNNPDATKATFHNGWLRTGDMGAMDAGGFVQFHDRLKDMVKTGGLNVYSQEVEQVLQRHTAVREAGIIGLPSDAWGEEVTGVIVLHDGKNASAAELTAFAKQHLSGYKVPKRFIFLPYEEMPINYSGKIMKRDLKQMIAAQERAET